LDCLFVTKRQGSRGFCTILYMKLMHQNCARFGV